MNREIKFRIWTGNELIYPTQKPDKNIVSYPVDSLDFVLSSTGLLLLLTEKNKNNMNAEKDIDEIIEKFAPYIEADGTELGESISALIAAWDRMDYYSEEFQAALEKEIRYCHEYITTNFEVVKEEYTYTRTTKSLKGKL